MPQQPITACPECDRPLAGAAGHCPVCGFAYDEHTCLWRASRTWAQDAATYGGVGLAVGLAVALLERIASGAVENALLPIVAGLVAGALGLLFQRVISGKVSNRYVAVTPRGILVGTRRPGRLIGWDDFRRVHTRERVPKLEIHSSPVPIALEDVLERRADVEAFIACLADALARYRPTP